MHKRDFLYNEIISKLRNQQSTPKDPEELTKQIMHKIQCLPQKTNKEFRKKRWIANIAAILIIAFFIYEAIDPAQNPTLPSPQRPSPTIYNIQPSTTSTKERINQYSHKLANRKETQKQRNAIISNLQLLNLKSQIQ